MRAAPPCRTDECKQQGTGGTDEQLKKPVTVFDLSSSRIDELGFTRAKRIPRGVSELASGDVQQL